MARQPLISVGVIRGSDFGVNSRRLTDDIRRRAIMALDAGGRIVQNAARKSILDGPKTGRLYKRGKTVTHQASAPGQPPANQTSTLLGTVIYEVDEQALTATITAGTVYAKYLEFGTRHMAARPFMNPALINNRPKILAVMRAVMKASTRPSNAS